MYGFRTRAGTLAVGTALACCETAVAQERSGDLLDSAFVAQVGTFLLTTDTRVRLDAASGAVGSTLDLRRDLGIGDANQFRADVTWRFAQRHAVRAMFFDSDRSATRRLAREIAVENTTFPVSAQVDSRFRTTVAQVAYEYSLLRRPTYEVAGTLGVHGVRIAFEVQGTGRFGSSVAVARRETADTRAPLPVLGLRGRWRVAPGWYAGAHGQYFSLSFDGYDGSLTDLRVDVTRMLGRNVGAGLGWNAFHTRVDVERESWNGSLRWQYEGLQLFVTAAF